MHGNRRLASQSILIWAGVPAIAFIAIIWFPFGFSMGGLYEEWDLLWLFDKHGLHWNAFPGEPTSHKFGARPLLPLPFLVARLIDDRSFLGFHLLLMTACALKVMGGASLGYTLFRSRTLALVLGLLVLVYPADTQQISLRTLHINLAVALMVCASALVLIGLLSGSRQKRILTMGAAIVLGLLGSWMYEPALPLYLLPPLLLFARLGIRKGARLVTKRRWAAAMWTAGVSTNVAYLYYALRIVGSPYQTAVSGGADATVLGSIITNSHRLLEFGAFRTFYEAWISAWDIASAQPAHGAYPVVVGIVVLILMRALAPDTRPATIVTSRALRFLTAGVIAAAVCYLPFLVSYWLFSVTQRTFLGVAPGAALIGTIMIAAVSRLSGVHVAFVAAIPVSLGLLAQVYQHDRYARVYVEVIRPYLDRVASASDRTKRVHLVFDTSGVTGFVNGIYASKLTYGVPVILRRPADVYVLCKDQPLSAASDFSNCRLENDRWMVTSLQEPPRSFEVAETEVIRVGPDFADRPLPSSTTWRHLGTFAASDSLFRSREGSPPAYECHAESTWGYGGFCAGTGWADAGSVVRDGWTTRSRFYAVAPEASLVMRMRPAEGSYTLRIKFSEVPPVGVAGRWSVALNGSVLEHRLLTSTVVEASVPATLIADGLNELRFENALGPGAPIGLAIEKAALVPAAQTHPVSIDAPPRLHPGERYLCNSASTSRVLEGGFSATESNGTWTDGPTATLRFSLPPTSRRMVLVASVAPFLNEAHPEMAVEVSVNGASATQQRFALPLAAHELRIPLPADALAAGTDVVVQLEIKNPAPPSAVGGGHRWLGLFFKEFEIREEG